MTVYRILPKKYLSYKNNTNFLHDVTIAQTPRSALQDLDLKLQIHQLGVKTRKNLQKHHPKVFWEAL